MLHAAGKFEFRGAAPGSYSLSSWDKVEEHERRGPEFSSKPFQSQAVPVPLAEGETETADLVIQTKSEEDLKP
jgi:hypothetical protein